MFRGSDSLFEDEDRYDGSDDDDYGGQDDSGWSDSSADEPMVRCPYCQFEMLEMCIRCPSCGQFPSQEDARPTSHPRWVLLAAVLCLCLTFFWLIVG